MNKLAILVGGGPAPGINSVIGAATIRARLGGLDVVGIRDGFEWIMQGDIDQTMPLTIDSVSRIHFRGGSTLGTSRANPTKDEKLLDTTLDSFKRLGVSQLITIGGDDTAYSAMTLERRSNGALRVVHVPKTIDNDLFLPDHVDTFGYQSARHYGAEIVKNLMVDAKTTSRWYFVVAMGRKAGHLALGIGKGAGTTLSLITEEFKRADPPHDHRRHADRRDHQAAQRRAQGRRGGDCRGRRPRHGRRGSRGAAGRRARQPRPPAPRRGRSRQHPQSEGPGAAAAARDQDHDRLEEHRLRAALRRSHPDGHGIHEGPRLLRRQVHARRRQRGDGLDAGRPLHSDPLRRVDRSRHRPVEGASGQHRRPPATPSPGAT